MFIKAADDRQPDIDALDALVARPALDAGARRRIEDELRRVRAGARGEREAAYEIEFHFGPKQNHLTIHDLRLEVAGRVAQIDHLIINRVLDIWVCESKHFAEGVAVDDFGEWTGFYNRRPFGIGSPIEQNRKHIAVLNDVFKKGLVRLPKRLGFALKPKLRSLVLVSKGARISRPKTKAGRARVDGLDTVIKIDQLKSVIDKDLEAKRPADYLRLAGVDEIERVARDLVALHRPAVTDWAARFGLPPEPTLTPPTSEAVPPPATCVNCGKPVSPKVIAFLDAHTDVFGGRILCFDCQRKARRGRI